MAVEMERVMAIRIKASQLQWGHGHVAVEMDSGIALSLTDYWLQWGHGHVAVEILLSHIVG